MKTNFTSMWCKLCCMLALILALQSCATKQKTIKQLRDLSYQIQNDGPSYDVQDWQRTAERYIAINKKLTKYDYTAEEAEEIGELNGKCIGYFSTSVASNVLGRVTNAAKSIGGLIKGIKEAYGK